MMCAQWKIICAVFMFCRGVVSSLTNVWTCRVCGSGIWSAVTSQGPIGANSSGVLPVIHCETRFCTSRAVKSCRHAYPKT